jgi:hypothetical protein
MRIASIIGIAGFFAASLSAFASSSYEVRLVARVEPYCRINTPDQQEISLVGGYAQIGVVHEICNTPGGYDVETSFTNVSGGSLNVAGASYLIDAHGYSVRRSAYPAIRDLSWQIANANVVAAVEPIIMRVTITPH